ncbi:MAG TPA: serine/threonine-protein kinase [Pirellulales bacterium]|nr:serine/threonine-protein kinase [Pirellulales bacterium]
MDLPATQLQTPPEPRAAAMKFTYTSGSRPLDGYTIKRGIGQGGFGEVYYATSDAGKEVALKLIRRNLDVELRGVTQCLNLKHPNLLALFDIKIDERGDSWVVMEYVAGESLEDVLARHPNGLPIDEALLWFHGIAAGVAYLHDRGIVHRDLKPGNIFNDDGLVKIGDYGLSKFISASRRSGQTESVGTVHYMAPEIANGRYGKEIDLYALGVILYELLSGQVPFEGESVGEVLMKHLTAEPDVSRVPEAFRGVVARSLAKDPQQRPHSVQEFLAALPTDYGRPVAPASLPSRPRPEPALAETTFLRSADEPPAPPQRAAAMPTGNAGVNTPPIGADAHTVFQRFLTWWTPLPKKKKILAAGAAAIVLSAVTQMGSGDGEAHTFSRILLLTVLILGGMRLAGWFSNRPIVAPATPRPAPPTRPVAAHPVAAATAQAPQPLAPPAQYPVRYSRRERRLARRSSGRELLSAKTSREKVTELFGSLLLSALVAGATSLLMLIVQHRDQQFYSEYAWLGLCAAMGAWGVLIPAKLWEGRQGDVVLRRFVMLGIGLAFGLAAFETGPRLLKIVLENDVHLPHVGFDSRSSSSVEGQPEVMSYLAYFGFLFLVLRWWKQADPLRSSRLSLWSLLVCVFWAGALSTCWYFPQPWGMMMAGAISLAVQLSSPWIDPQNRVAQAASAPAAST